MRRGINNSIFRIEFSGVLGDLAVQSFFVEFSFGGAFQAVVTKNQFSQT
jgi:hypothetical protein